MILTGETDVKGETPVPLSLCPPQQKKTARYVLRCMTRQITESSTYISLPYQQSAIYVKTIHIWEPSSLLCGPGSSVGIATELQAGRSGIESWWGRDFLPIQTGSGAHPASCTMGTGSFPGGRLRPRHAADHSPPSSAAVMEE